MIEQKKPFGNTIHSIVKRFVTNRLILVRIFYLKKLIEIGWLNFAQVKLKEDYREGRQMLDVMDQILFDFLTGNKDRHHFAYFKGFRGATFMLNYDNGNHYQSLRLNINNFFNLDINCE